VDLVFGSEHRIRAVTVRQVNGNKPPDNLLVELRQTRLLQTQPARKVTCGIEIAVLGLLGISAVAKVGKKRGNMRI
jgi:hypothetical protein